MAKQVYWVEYSMDEEPVRKPRHVRIEVDMNADQEAIDRAASAQILQINGIPNTFVIHDRIKWSIING